MNPHAHPGTGLLVDIHRFSLHDGPGIRTTVFLKGCPLNCTWCHNPEAIAYRPQLSFDPERCTNCFRCVDACTSGAHSIVEGRHQVDFSKCALSGACVEACPSEALAIIGKQMTVQEVLSVILRDKEYYERSGGGVTISGGEPMTQLEFTKALLAACKAHNIHTTLDTCGHVPPGRYREVLPFVDLFLYDYKESHSERHRDYTGVSNTLILQNLEMLHAAGAKIVLRCPIVPGVNDTVDHFRGIRDLTLRYPDLAGIELMPYHNMGVGKGRKIGVETTPHAALKSTDKAVSRQWVEELTALGCYNVTAG